jgi:ribonuclease HI
MKQGFVLVSDGACSKNPGPGGWGLIVLSPDGRVREFGGADEATTNNRMELFGVYRGLQEVYRSQTSSADSKEVLIISDSKYVLDGAQKSVWNWIRNGWKTSAGEAVKNQDLWEKIHQGLSLLQEKGFRFEYRRVKGHAGSEANERVDQIAVRFSRGESIDLYDGPSDRYAVSLDPASRFEVVFLSYAGGKLLRHKTWDECKAVVEGKQGVRYKKVKNRIEEEETLRSWGVR